LIEPPKVFITYSHDSQNNKRVLDLSNRLRKDGIDCNIDQYENSPPEGWPRWTVKQIEDADFVILVCTESYAKRFNGHQDQQKCIDVNWEGAIFTQELYDAMERKTSFIPVIFSRDDLAYIPEYLHAATYFTLDNKNGYEALYRVLTNQTLLRPSLGPKPSFAPKLTPPPTVFISYSWDNEDHQLWVLKLASKLIRNRVNVLIDEWDLVKYRNDLHYFMESGIRESDYVIIICTPNYAERANCRKGGVGIENTIITGEFYDENNYTKYILIARNYDKNVTECLPSYLKTKFAMDFKDDSKYDQKIEAILRKIYNIPRYERPKLAETPPDLKSEII